MSTRTTTATATATPGPERRDTIFQKQKRLEGYLLHHPNSALFAWYGRQNMEIGKLDRAEKICQLGLNGETDHIILRKLLGDIYLAQGRIAEAREEYAIVLQSHRPFPGVIQTYLKNWKSELTPQEEAALMRRLSFIIPGNADVVKYFKLQSDADRILTRPDRRDFLPGNQDTPTTPQNDEPVVDAMESVKPPSPKPGGSKKTVSDKQEPVEIPKVTVAAEITAPAKPDTHTEKPQAKPAEPKSGPVIQSEESQLLAPNHKIKVQPTPEPEDTKPQKITRSMATFTLMQIFKDQGLYQHALQVLEILREKSPNTERVETEIDEINLLIAQQAAENQA
ncbi:MAG: hypothetical protein CO167_02980 [Candidatus Marinimicrobia bacterium CG_4_9_14_3_um_filter_48_9]|nr:MAG: hypothetical protein CO167_02980 [Candidatus Marinimicrobia bacterium CG_4_9_14_3_um_filter_48_9]